MSVTLPARSEVPVEHTWDLKSIFATDKAWSEELERLRVDAKGFERYKGNLGSSSKLLLEYMNFMQDVLERFGRMFVYALQHHDQDTAQELPMKQAEESRGILAVLMAAQAFEAPEILSIGQERLDVLMREEPKLELFRHYFRQILDRKEHIRSSEVEEVLALASEPLGTPDTVYRKLSDTDLQFPQVKDQQGKTFDVAQGTIDMLLSDQNREVRKASWHSYADGFLSVKHTMAAAFAGNIKSTIFLARARRHQTALSSMLHANHIPPKVYQQTIEQCRKHLPIWHRYWEIRRRVLGLPKLESYDVFAPLCATPPAVPYQQAIEYVTDGMKPLGDEYCVPLKRGLTEERWVDVFPNKGKRSNAYSSGSKGTHPFILLNYGDNLSEMSVLAHELGHSMHSYFTNLTQPYVYAGYSIFVAEVASNFNQALVRAHILKNTKDKNFEIAMLEEAFANFHRYLFIMPILAQLELEAHQIVEEGGALTADLLIQMMAKLFAEGYGPAVNIDEQRVGITWAQFGHFYMPFYVYQYSTGIAAANALAEGVLKGEKDSVANYMKFLKAGSSVYPLDALKIAGIDMESEKPMQQAFKVLERFVNRLDELV